MIGDIDRMWLHELGKAEGIDSLVDPWLFEMDLRQSRKNQGLCVECGACGELRRGPDAQLVCGSCRADLIDS